MAIQSAEKIEVSAQQLARIMRCNIRTIERLSTVQVIKTVRPNRYLLWESIGNVIDHYRRSAAGRGTAETAQATVELKQAQRRLTDLKYDQLRGELISMPDIEAVWADLVRSAKWLFLTLPERARFALPHLGTDDLGTLERVCQEMLKELTMREAPPMPKAPKAEDIEDEVSDDELEDEKASDAGTDPEPP